MGDEGYNNRIAPPQPLSVIERVNAIEMELSATRRQLQEMTERVAFLEQKLGAGANWDKPTAAIGGSVYGR